MSAGQYSDVTVLQLSDDGNGEAVGLGVSALGSYLETYLTAEECEQVAAKLIEAAGRRSGRPGPYAWRLRQARAVTS